MTAASPRISIVGAGIVGASLAYHLARRGALVQLYDAAAGPAGGVTGSAFGWINLINGNPADRPAYGLRREALADYGRLERELPEALRSARRGSLVWKRTAQATEALVSEHKAEGAAIELVERRAISAAEPHLRNVPEVAALSANDLAINPLHITETLVRAAIASGAVVSWGQEINGIEASGSRVTGLRIADQTIAADIVIVAAGPGTNLLTSAIGIDLGLEISPVLLLRYKAEDKLIDRILCGPDLEIRQADDNSLLLVDGHVDFSSENGPEGTSRRALDIVKRDFDVPGAVSFHSASVGPRPMFSDGLPRLGFAAEMDGLYVAVGHPGVILAPLLGRLAAEEIVAGKRSPLLHPIRKAGKTADLV